MKKEMLKAGVYIFVCFGLIFLASCEKEITINVPPGNNDIIVEANINQKFPTLNYVFITTSLDYFKPDLTMNGFGGAKVYITEGAINGSDTVFDLSNRYQFIDIADTIIPGIYVNPVFTGKQKTAYLLEIEIAGRQKIIGRTFIPEVKEIDSVNVRVEISDNKKDTNVFLKFSWIDGPEQNNYRFAMKNYPDSNLLGWGGADSYSTFDDRFINNARRYLEFGRPFEYGDTINLYLNSIGREEFLFWQSFTTAVNNGGPFATPVSVKSNIRGAIGSFTGWGVSSKQVIMR